MGREYMGSSVAKVCCGWTLVSFVFAALAAGTSEAAPSLDKPEPLAEVPFGAYLAGRHAQQERDYRAAATWFESALKADPGSPELITRAFLMEASVGDFGRAKPLAESELKLDSTDAMADLILLIDRVKADDNFKKTLEASPQLNWRLTDTMANFYERHGRNDEAQALYERFVKDNAGSELAESILDGRPSGPPHPQINSPEDGLAEALFDLASVVNQPETLELALLYGRCALQLRPNMVLA